MIKNNKIQRSKMKKVSILISKWISKNKIKLKIKKLFKKKRLRGN